MPYKLCFRQLLALLAVLTLTVNVRGQSTYDFSAVSPSGHTLYYKLVLGTAMVTYELDLWQSGYPIHYTTFPSGDLVIPDTVTNNGIAYPVTRIDFETFLDCSGLSSVVIPNTVIYIGQGAFMGCSGLTTISIPESVSYLTGGVFADCTGLTSVVLPNSMFTVAGGLFSGCTNLTTVTIGSSVTRIESYAFEDCVNLTSVYLLCNIAIPQLWQNAFFSSSGVTPLPHTATFYVPCGTTTDYVTAWQTDYIFSENWIPYALNIGVNDTLRGSVDVEVTSCGQGVLSANANSGYFFTGWEDGNTDNPRTVIITQDSSFTAIFDIDTNTIHTDTVILHDTVFVQDTTYPNFIPKNFF